MENVVVKDVVFNEGLPKICVPLVGKTKAEIEMELSELSWDQVDIVEWRMDMCDELDDAIEIAKMISSEYPLLATFRTSIEGGNKEYQVNEYIQLYKLLIDHKCVDMIDVEYKREEVVKELVEYAHDSGVKVILSYHNFNHTEEEKLIFAHMRNMTKLNADICKIAVMPKTEEDVITILQTSIHLKKQMKTPYILLSMGKLGMITRMCVEMMGSCMTFGKAIQSSAPGQIAIDSLKEILMVLHQK